MNKAIWFSIGLLIFIGCNKHEDTTYVPGKIITTVNYTGYSGMSTLKSNNLKATQSDIQYTGFGDYIMSITPNKVSAKFYCIRYVNDLAAQSMIELINNNLPPNDSLRYADFTNNSSVSLVPSLGGDLRDEGASFANSVEFNYLLFDIANIYNEVQLPPEYAGIDILDQFYYPNTSPGDESQVYCTLSNNILNARYRLFLTPIYEIPQVIPTAIVFGGTDTSYVLDLATDIHDFPYNTPYHGNYIIRSKNYNPITYVPSETSDKTTLINATLSFDYYNLIQIYAGIDNIPFTRDDIFLYEPDFFDRFTVNVSIE